MTLEKRINAFVTLGTFLKQFSGKGEMPSDNILNKAFNNNFNELILSVHFHNGWFTEDNVRNAIVAVAGNLELASLNKWLSVYPEISQKTEPKSVAVIMAGNIPLVGFHDMLCVLLSGNKFVGKLSSDDKLLLPFIAKIIIEIEPEFEKFIEFTEGQIKNIDAVIATGSNNSARYFEYYFGKYPHIIRKNRNSVAIISGNESKEELGLLGKDIFQYFGLGCRNVSKLFVPTDYNFDLFYQSVFDFQGVINNNKYGNNYDYNRTVYLMSNHPSLLDNNFLLLKEDTAYSSPIGVLFYEFYEDVSTLSQRLEKDKEQLQCIVSSSLCGTEIVSTIPFGEAQCPQLGDYADGVDVLSFLIGL